MGTETRLYHGTCKAFVAYAMQNGNQFGPDYDRVCFTPQMDHAQMFAEDWQKPAGLERLRQYFGDNIDERLTEPVVLEFDRARLGKLGYREDGGADEFYVEKGPVSLDGAREVNRELTA